MIDDTSITILVRILSIEYAPKKVSLYYQCIMYVYQQMQIYHYIGIYVAPIIETHEISRPPRASPPVWATG